MAHAMVNFRMDEKLKKDMDETCRKMGLTMTSAFTMFAVKVTSEQRIPFEISANPNPYVLLEEEKILADLEESRRQADAGDCYDAKTALEEMGAKHGFV